MAVTVTDGASGPYFPNGVTFQFPFAFKAAAEDEVAAIMVAGDGSISPIDESAYSVILGVDGEGGVLSMTTPPPADGRALYVVSEPSFAQEILFEDEGPFNASILNPVADRSAIRDIYLKGKVDRALQVPFGESGSILPPVGQRANRFMAFGPDGAFRASSGTGADAGLRVDLGTPGGADLVVDDLGIPLENHIAIFRAWTVHLRKFQRPNMPIGIGIAANDDAAMSDAFAWQMANRRAIPAPAGGLAYLLPAIEMSGLNLVSNGNLGGVLEAFNLVAIQGTASVRVIADAYLFVINKRLNSTVLRGITFLGGRGYFRHTYTGNNVSLEHEISGCTFFEYTGAAISSEAEDMPYWSIFRNQFYSAPNLLVYTVAGGSLVAGALKVMAPYFAGKAVTIEVDGVFTNGAVGADGTVNLPAPAVARVSVRYNRPTICKGIAIGGLLDCGNIRENRFCRNDYHLQVGPLRSGNLQIGPSNDFISFEESRTICDILLVPNDGLFTKYGTNAGQGTAVLHNKFGNEGIVSFAAKRPRMIIAALPAGVDRASAAFDPGWKDGGNGNHYLNDVRIEGNRIATASPMGNPDGPDANFADVYINGMDRTVWRDNAIDGGRFNWIFEFKDGGARRPSKINSNWQIDVNAPSQGNWKLGFASSPVGVINDPHGVRPSDATVMRGKDPDLVVLASRTGNGDWSVTPGNAYQNAVPGRRAGLTATRVGWNDPGAFLFMGLPNLAAYVNQLAWIVLEFSPSHYSGARSWTDALDLYVETFNFSAQVRNFVYPVDGQIGRWQTIELPFFIPQVANPGDFQLRMKATTAGVAGKNELFVGRCVFAVGRSAPSLDIADPIPDLAIAPVSAAATLAEAAKATDVDARFDQVEAKVNAMLAAARAFDEVKP